MSSEYPPPSGYGQYPPPGGYGEHDRPAPKNGAAIAGLVLGVVALLLCFTLVAAPLSLLLAIVGLVLSIVGFRRVGRGRATNKGVAVTGLVINVLTILISAVVSALVIAGLVVALNNGGTEAWNCFVDADGDQAAVQRCVDDLNARAGVQ